MPRKPREDAARADYITDYSWGGLGALGGFEKGTKESKRIGCEIEGMFKL